MTGRFSLTGLGAYTKISQNNRVKNIPHGLGVRIPDSHSGGPGSIPGVGEIVFIFFKMQEK